MPAEGSALILCYVLWMDDVLHFSYLFLEFKVLAFGCTNMRINISMEIHSCLSGHVCLFAHKIPSDILSSVNTFGRCVL